MFTIIINAINGSKNLKICLELVEKNIKLIKNVIVIVANDEQLECSYVVKQIKIAADAKLGQALNDIVRDGDLAELVCYLQADTFLMPEFLAKSARSVQSIDNLGMLFPAANVSREARWRININADSLPELFEKTALINNSPEIHPYPVLRIDDYCIVLRSEIFADGVCFNECFSAELYMWQDFAFQLMLHKRSCVFVQHAVVCVLSNELYPAISQEDEYYFKKCWGQYYDKLLGFDSGVLSKVPTNEGLKTVLHIGCRAGALLGELTASNSSMRLEGLEADDRYAAIAGAIGNVKVYHPPISSLPYPDSEFSCVIVDGILDNGLDCIMLLAEVQRILRPDGFAVITALNAQYADFLKQLLKDERDYSQTKEYNDLAERHFSHNQLCHAIQSAGMEIEGVLGQVGKPNKEFLQVLERTDSASAKMLSIERFIVKIYQSKRDIQFSLRKLEYDYDCYENAAVIAEQISGGQCSMEQLIFYLGNKIIYKDRAIYNLLNSWRKQKRIDLIEGFCDCYVAKEELDKQLLADILELIMK